jgi:hypothetical protein
MCDAAGYLRVLDTYSGHRSLGDDACERLFSSIADLFDTKFGGIIVKGLPDNPVRGPQEVEALSLQGRHDIPTIGMCPATEKFRKVRSRSDRSSQHQVRRPRLLACGCVLRHRLRRTTRTLVRLDIGRQGGRERQREHRVGLLIGIA